METPSAVPVAGRHRHRQPRKGLNDHDTTNQEWGLSTGHQRGPELATSGDFFSWPWTSRRSVVHPVFGRIPRAEGQRSSPPVRERFSFCGRCWVRTNVDDWLQTSHKSASRRGKTQLGRSGGVPSGPDSRRSPTAAAACRPSDASAARLGRYPGRLVPKRFCGQTASEAPLRHDC